MAGIIPSGVICPSRNLFIVRLVVCRRQTANQWKISGIGRFPGFLCGSWHVKQVTVASPQGQASEVLDLFDKIDRSVVVTLITISCTRNKGKWYLGKERRRGWVGQP
jgi:hypothetical protein